MISKGYNYWNMHDTITCDHTDPCKEAKFFDPISPPLEYIKHCGVSNAKKTNKYDLCHFYQVGLSGDLLDFPMPHEPATCEWVSKFLLKARSLGQPNLIVAHPWDSVMAVCLLQELHIKDRLQHLLMEPKMDAAGKTINKLSFGLFCMYLGSNDPLYMNHIICDHYNMNYGCRKCLKEVFTTGQPLKTLMKVCKGLPEEAADEASVEDVDHTHALLEKKKGMSKDHSPDSWLAPPQSSQESSQVSMPQSQHAKKKPVLTPKKSQSSHREEECSFCHKHHSDDKSGEKSSADKHSPKKSHKKSSKKSSKKFSKKSTKEKHQKKEKPGKEKQHDHDKAGKDKSSKSDKK